MTYRLARRAETDLERAYIDGVKKFGMEAAESYYLRLLETFDLLSDEPGIGTRRKSRGRPVRIHPHGSHIIIYRSTPTGIEILRVRHQRENWAVQFT